MEKIRDYKVQAIEKANHWLSEFFDRETRETVESLLKSNNDEVVDMFYKNMEFGTGGMRGIMGVGTNRINKYTLGKNTQGLSNYLKKIYPDTSLKVVIAYDCRHNSKSLAKDVADVFSANGIKVYLFNELRTTPELSFAVRYLDCHAGIVLTASHNPPEYNGYKVYWTDGGQIVPPQDKEIIQEINNIDFQDVKFDPNIELIEYIDEAVDKPFLEQSTQKGSFIETGRDQLRIVFTSLHGTSITAIPQVLKNAGYTDVHIIEEQAVPDGDFPTVKSPNPEEPEALSIAIKKAEEIDADIVIGTDPDSDRLGIAVRNREGKIELLNGNQTMLLMTKFLLDRQKEKGFKGHEFIASTIVSTPAMKVLGDDYGIECKISLTGFKWIAKMIKDFPDQHFIGGGEESFGFMVGDFVRDKDAVTSTLLACEIATKAKTEGSSFYEELIACYQKYDLFQERLVALVKKGVSGAEDIKNMMISFRENPIKQIAGSPVIMVEDYLSSEKMDLISGEKSTLDIPKSNVLIFIAEDGSRVAARPSGTEPKIKFYMSVNTPFKNKDDFSKSTAFLESKLDSIVQSLGV